MIKKYYWTVLLVIVGFSFSNAQRFIPKKKGIEVNFGVSSTSKIGHDYYTNLGFTINGKNGNYLLWALEYTHEYDSYKNTLIPHETYTIEGGHSFLLLSDSRKNIILNLALTALAGYESFNRGITLLDDGAKILNEEKFIYGTGGRLSVEIYLTDYLVFLLQGRTKMIWGTDLQQFQPSVGFGLRYNL